VEDTANYSKLEPNNAGVARTTTFTTSGGADAHGNAVGQAIDRASFGVGPRMHRPAAYTYRISFSSNFRFPEDNTSDRLYIASASGKFVTGPNASIAFALSDVELGKEGVEGDVAIYGSDVSPSI
jgi:hypothetical protein